MNYCHNCKKIFNYRGTPRHRAMHRERKELVTITMKTGTFEWDYREAE